MKRLKNEWLSNVRGDLLAGIVVAMALMPEVIGFSIVAGVEPMVGVYASFVISLITAIFGGRPGLISAAAGATALVLASLVATHGIQYLFAATILTGLLQIVFGLLKIGKLMKFIPKPVMIGFVNALGILMFQSQVAHFIGNPLLIGLGVLGVAVIYLFPRITKAIPSPMVAIVIITVVVNVFKIQIPMLGDLGSMTTKLPSFILPDVPYTLETLQIVFPYAISVALVGIVESLLTSQLVDGLTDTDSDKNKESVGQGLANVGAGFFGGIAGCGMIGQTIVNINYGGRGRLSTLLAGTIMLFAIIGLNDVVVKVPVVALASVMLVVSFSTINWESFKRIRQIPKSDTIIMLCTVTVVLITHNLAYGVIAGIVISSVIFAAKMAEIDIDHEIDEDKINYKITGELYFASTTKFLDSFNYDHTHDIKTVHIDFSNVKVWDESAVEAIDKVIVKYHNSGIDTNLIGLSASCADLLDKAATYHTQTGVKKKH